MTRDINSLLDRRKKGILLTLDLAKAFDSIDRNRLLKMLPGYGIDGIELEWTESYFESRRQIVTVGGVDSSETPIEFGVIQGGTLAATFFLIFINELGSINPHSITYLFADDTAILCEGDTWDEVFERANSDINATYEWLCRNRLSLNVKKTKYLVFSKSPSKSNVSREIKIHQCGAKIFNGSIMCKCPLIERVSSARYLGIIIDENLKWESHVSSTVQRLRKFAHLFYELRGCLGKELLSLVYKALVQSVISFGIIA